MPIGSSYASNNDSDDNGQLSASASHFLVHFFAITAQPGLAIS